MNTTQKAILIAVSLFLSAPAFAYDIKVGRDYNVDVNTGSNTVGAMGNNAHAALNNGGFMVKDTNVNIGRDYKVNVKTGANTAVAMGNNVSAHLNNGGIMSNH